MRYGRLAHVATLRTIGCVALLLVLTGCAEQGRDATIVFGPASAIELTMELQVGAIDSVDAILFNYPGVVDVDDAGFMYVTDWSDFLVRALDPDGNLVTTMGRRGEGPGEFRAPPGRTFISGDSAMVLWVDGLSMFHRRTGEYLGRVDLPGAYNYSQILERDGFVWTLTMPGSLARIEVLGGAVLSLAHYRLNRGRWLPTVQLS